jgi:type IX secretion system PorP/SprF family membrane protein
MEIKIKPFYTLEHRELGTIVYLLFIILLGCTEASEAQLNPLGSIYYQNQYLANPAMAGMENGFNLNAGYRKQWSSIPGSPQSQSFSADYGFGNRVGIGMIVLNEKAGLLQRSNVMGTYAYHLPVGSENQKLNFGLSLGFKNERINSNDVNGDPDDATVGRFNQRETYIDGDFGLAYTSGSLSIQGAVPNMKTFFKKDYDFNTVDHAVFFSAVSYKFYSGQSGDDIEIEPKVAYRGVKGYDNIIDMGTNVAVLDGALNFMGMWHSSESVTFGVGMNYKRSFTFMGMYTTDTGKIRGYSNGDFEIALKLKVF